MIDSQAAIKFKLEKARLLEHKIHLKESLPHLYGFPWYPWARRFFDSRNKMALLVAANQISKSSTQIRQCIDWATNKELWPKLWRTRPLQFWYLYPSKDQATIEFDKKWVPEFLPRGDYKNHIDYGWKEEYRGKDIFAVHFNTGVSVYFKTYAQDVQHLQTGTCHAIFCDEELPEELFDELFFRLTSTDGYFRMVFTATLGQEFWREAMEIKGELERFKDADKQCVSLYECLNYEDGSDSPWSIGRIKRLESMCKSQAEIDRRIKGRFVKDMGLKYPGFDKESNVKKSHPLPAAGHLYAAVDIGSGGAKGHPAAMVFVWVAPDFKSGRVFKGWRGDGIDTTSSDILQKFIELKGPMRLTCQWYDGAAKDFYNLAVRIGEPFVPAEKGHDLGEDILNVLFKNKMLIIYVDDDDHELPKLVQELCSVSKTGPKNKAKDDFADALRYSVAKIPWDWSSIAETQNVSKVEEPREKTETERRREMFTEAPEGAELLVDDEIAMWQELYDV